MPRFGSKYQLLWTLVSHSESEQPRENTPIHKRFKQYNRSNNGARDLVHDRSLGWPVSAPSLADLHAISLLGPFSLADILQRFLHSVVLRLMDTELSNVCSWCHSSLSSVFSKVAFCWLLDHFLASMQPPNWVDRSCVLSHNVGAWANICTSLFIGVLGHVNLYYW
jgi:hypothetical protein